MESLYRNEPIVVVLRQLSRPPFIPVYDTEKFPLPDALRQVSFWDDREPLATAIRKMYKRLKPLVPERAYSYFEMQMKFWIVVECLNKMHPERVPVTLTDEEQEACDAFNAWQKDLKNQEK